jgi:THO complex subunit 3
MAWTAYSDHLLVATGSTGKSDMGGVDIMRFADNDLVNVSSIPSHTSNCFCLKIDSNFQRFAVGSADYLVSLWDLENLVCYNTITTIE